MINPSGAETGIIQKNYVITEAVDALAPCITRTSGTMVLIMKDKLVLDFYEGGF